MRKLILLIAAMCLPIIALAQQRTESEAISIAKSFWGSPQAKLKAVPQMKINQAKARVAAKAPAIASNPCYYVVNDEANGRFVIVSADERLYTILGYSDNGVFDAEKAPLGLLDMLYSYDTQYSFLSDKDIQLKKTPQRKQTESIEPLIQTKWGQETPYNDNCPKNKAATDDSKCASGCVATAMAQVMNYYQYPATGQGFYAYQSATQKHNLTLDFSSTVFDWNRLINTYGNESTEEQKAEVAKLMYACGVAVSMDYGSSSDGQSGAAPTDIPYAMIKYFGYNPNINYKIKDYYGSEEWDSMIMTELKSGHPILYGGYNSAGKGGHRFILDGCDENGLYHFNFGWTIPGWSFLDGHGNGYYSLELLKPNFEFFGENVDLGDFSYQQSMICNVSPATSGEHEDIFYLTGDFDAPMSVNIGENAKFSFYSTNYSSASSSNDINKPKFNGVLGIGLFDTNFNFIKSLYEEANESKIYQWQGLNCRIICDGATFSNGSQFYIAPYAKGDGYDRPTRIRGKQGSSEYYLAQISGGKIKFTANGIMTPHTIATGSYVVSANGGEDRWQIELAKDITKANTYLISNFDPSVKDIREVYATSNESGTQLSVSLTQQIQNGVLLYNSSDPSYINIAVNPSDNSMSITDSWGSIETKEEESKEEGSLVQQKELSRYSNTQISYGTLLETPDKTVSAPVVSVDQKSNMVTILCGEEDADIFYTLDGNNPTKESFRYEKPFTVFGNCDIKCVATRGDIYSDVVTKRIDWFVLEKPQIIVSDDRKTVTMKSNEETAVIFYTTDGSTPTRSSNRYDGPIENTRTTTYKAIATMDGFNDSKVETLVVETIGDGMSIEVNDNIAGELSTRFAGTDIYAILDLKISGQLNGTDIKYLRNILQNGKLIKLDISQASIVSGGEKYDNVYTTSDNVIGDNMFEDSKTLIEINLPSDITALKSFAFSNCKSLVAFTVPKSCEIISDYAFRACSGLENFYVQEGNTYFKSVDGILFSFGGDTLVKVPSAKDINDYEIPNSVVHIANRAFEGTNVTTIKFPEILQTLGSYSFSNCKNISDIQLPDGVTEIGSGAFEDCKSLVNVKLPSSLTKIESFTFGGCVNLRTLTIPESVEVINQHALNGCPSLQNIEVDANNKFFCSYDGVLYSRDMKTMIMYPRGLKTEEYHVADGVEEVSARAFAGCTNIQNIVLPNTINKIGEYAFDQSSLKSINLPNTIDYIGDYAFSDCDSLLSMSLPESIQRISNGLMSYSDKVSYLWIPSTVYYIGLSAFSRCKSLEVIECWIADIDEVEFSVSYGGEIAAFNSIKMDCTWHVPNGCAEAYKAQPWWMSTWNIVDDLYSGVDTISNEEALNITVSDGYLTVTGGDDCIVCIYNSNGILVKRIELKDGRSETVELPNGVYFVNGNKVLVK